MRDILARFHHIKYLAWAAALSFALGIAFLIFTLAGFGRGLGPSVWWQTVTNAVVALATGTASQVGLVLAPVGRVRGVVLRGAITLLMAPAFVLGVLSYRDVLSRVEGLGLKVIDHPLVLLFLSIVPVYVTVAVWLWRAPRPQPANVNGRGDR
ncbi:MAG: hypothetical protein ACRET3_09105 [Burkholderiales bacterium]